MILENKISNRFTDLFIKKDKVLSVYFTAGYPTLEDTGKIILLLQKYGVDSIEIGIPFSDSLMDGPVIQQANTTALENGMTIDILFRQLKEIKDKLRVPLILMSSMNPVYQYGFERFCKNCAVSGVQGTIIPEMRIEEFHKNYQALYKENNISGIFMITPQTTDERIKLIDESSDGFIYMISSNSTTGNAKSIYQNEEYFKKVKKLKLKNPSLIGFNINTKEDVYFASRYSKGVIVGTAFIKAISEGIEEEKIQLFLERYK
jgi:tryptophan synthase alpha chain